MLSAPAPYPLKIFTVSPFLYRRLPIKGSSKTASEKWGVVLVNAYMVSLNLVPNKGKRWVKSAVVILIPIKARKGTRYKNKDKSAARPRVLIPFTHKYAEKTKKNTKENTVGAVSKKAAYVNFSISNRGKIAEKRKYNA